MSTELIEQIREVLDEDERIARATMLTESDDGQWVETHDPDTGEPNGVLGHCMHIGLMRGGGDLDDPAQARHIARQDPKWTLALVEAHRKILDAHPVVTKDGFRPWCATCDDQTQDYPCETVLALAEAYGIEEMTAW